MNMRRDLCRSMLLSVLCLACTASPATGQQGSMIWVEGESATRSQTFRNTWFDNVDGQELSGGRQIASFSEPQKPEGWAEYDFDVKTAGDYHVWLRANPCSGLLFRLDGGASQKLDQDALQRQDDSNRDKPGYVRKVQQWFNVAADGTQDARSMTWYQPCDFHLAVGQHTLRFDLGGEDQTKARFAALDCFVLTTGDFAPNFQLRPGETLKDIVSDAPGSTWAFDPPRDPLAPSSMLDLRFLNEKVAGEHGFIRVSPDGAGFVRGDGQPIRFWGGCDYVQRLAREQKSQTVLEHHAQFLAKRGVNAVRLHGAIQPKGPDSKIEDVDAQELDEIYRLVAGMKKAGIYTMIDPYWAVEAHAQKNWGVADSANGNLTGLIFFDKALQRGYKAWLKRIYADVNPYTGIPLAKDPSVLAIQIQNEDGLLFWTEQTIHGQARLNLRKLYGDWLLRKYGSFDAALTKWQGYKADDDDFSHGLPGMFIVWELTQDARNKKGSAAGREARLADQTEFIARTMYNFNAEIARYLREDLGCKQMVLPGNWRTADQVVLDDAERWSYLAGDVEAKNHYFTGVHNGVNVGWQILPGHVYTSRSWTKDPVGSPLGIRQVVDRPFMIPESLWVPPNRYEAEGPMIAAAQSALTGLGTFFWFATGEEEWQQRLIKWTYAIPTTLGQFPAAALSYRLRYVTQGKTVVHEERSLADVFGRRMPLIAEEGAWDPNRDTVQLPSNARYSAAIDPLAFLVGRVEVKYGGDASNSKVMPLAPFIDHTRNVVRSVTGQITTDLDKGLYRIDAPKVQSVSGFLGASGAQNLTDVRIDCKNDFASVAVASLDGGPLATSHRVLIQVGTESRPTGWKERPMTFQDGVKQVAARRILDTGHGPWQIVKARLTLSIRNRVLHSAHVLDPNGDATGLCPIKRSGDSLTMEFPPDALYVVLD